MFLNKINLQMKQFILISFLGIFCFNAHPKLYGQSCGTRQLDPAIAAFLKMIGYKDLSLEELRAMPIEQIKYAGPPEIHYPKEDVRRIKITADSIPILIFNSSHLGVEFCYEVSIG